MASETTQERVKRMRDEAGVSRQLFHKRVAEGWDREAAASTPPQKAPWQGSSWRFVSVTHKVYPITVTTNNGLFSAYFEYTDSEGEIDYVMAQPRKTIDEAIQVLVADSAAKVGFLQLCPPNTPALHEIWPEKKAERSILRRPTKTREHFVFTNANKKERKGFHEYEDIDDLGIDEEDLPEGNPERPLGYNSRRNGPFTGGWARR